jgi:hypothetical protein
VDASATTIGTVFIGSAYDTVNGTLDDYATHSRIMPFHPGAARIPCRSRHQAFIAVKREVATAFYTSNNCISVGCTRVEK